MRKSSGFSRAEGAWSLDIWSGIPGSAGVPPASVNDAFHFVESGISGNRLAVWALEGRMMVPRTLYMDRWAVGKTLTYVSVLRGKGGG